MSVADVFGALLVCTWAAATLTLLIWMLGPYLEQQREWSSGFGFAIRPVMVVLCLGGPLTILFVLLRARRSGESLRFRTWLLARRITARIIRQR